MTLVCKIVRWKNEVILLMWHSRSMLRRRVSKCVSFMCWRRSFFKFCEISVDMMERLCTPLTCVCTFEFDSSGSITLAEMQSPSCRNPTNFSSCAATLHHSRKTYGLLAYNYLLLWCVGSFRLRTSTLLLMNIRFSPWKLWLIASRPAICPASPWFALCCFCSACFLLFDIIFSLSH